MKSLRTIEIARYKSTKSACADWRVTLFAQEPAHARNQPAKAGFSPL